MSNSPVFLAPMRVEAMAIRRGAREAEIERIGMGPKRAKQTTEMILPHLVTGWPVVILGLGGALLDDQRAGEVVVANELCSSGGDERHELSGANEVAQRLCSAGLSVRTGAVVCAEKIVKGDERERLAATGALAVEMESLWCLPLASGRPFAVVRVILDVVGKEVLSLSTPFAFKKAAKSIAVAARSLRSWTPGSLEENPTVEVGS